MGPRMIVAVKQVPDTMNVTGDAMKADGTVNRAALPTIFNPEDLNALEEALKIKDELGGTVTVITMGPPKAVEVLKECLYRGADDAIIVTDPKFAGADTLATSYALQCSVEKIKEYDLIFCGRQAIDGDTAQVGPQLAEKLGINQITCIHKVNKVQYSGSNNKDNSITVTRTIDNGVETVKAPFPLLLTVTGEASEPRPFSVKKVMRYKKITKKVEAEGEVSPCGQLYQEDGVPYIREWHLDSIQADMAKCGLGGSPTKVKGIENVVLQAKEVQNIPNTKEDIGQLVKNLLDEHIIG